MQPLSARDSIFWEPIVADRKSECLPNDASIAGIQHEVLVLPVAKARADNLGRAEFETDEIVSRRQRFTDQPLFDRTQRSTAEQRLAARPLSQNVMLTYVTAADTYHVQIPEVYTSSTLLLLGAEAQDNRATRPGKSA